MPTTVTALRAPSKRRDRPERRKTPYKHITVDREQLAWAAGFFDGEGCFVYNLKWQLTQWNSKYIASLGQVDIRVLEKFQRIVQLGRIYGPYGPYGANPGKKQPHYRLDIYGFEQVQTLLALMWTWLGPVKREQAKSVLYSGV